MPLRERTAGQDLRRETCGLDGAPVEWYSVARWSASTLSWEASGRSWYEQLSSWWPFTWAVQCILVVVIAAMPLLCRDYKIIILCSTSSDWIQQPWCGWLLLPYLLCYYFAPTITSSRSTDWYQSWMEIKSWRRRHLCRMHSYLLWP